jgi:hypothetical protein
MKLAHHFKRIRLNLARSKAFPAGSDLHGYEFVAPLDAYGHIDSKLWKEQRENCRVRRFWNGDDEQIGWLVHKPGGPSTPGGCSTTTLREATMMSPDIDSVAMPSARANTYRSHTRTICIPSR